ncbi:SLAC1 anion channel family protein [Paenibacillus sp. GCM10023250]|uniref:SLAC1 anion channel family protein n=1 Tax=Paenibacillus sp. GCM10023250 TaxID=3252648 RepID=UPI003606B531
MHTMAAVRKPKSTSSVQFLPVNLFGSVMGISGLSLAWRQASTLFGTAPIIAEVIGIAAILVFIVLSIGYILKWILYPRKVMNEFTHPVSGNFFGTITISILLLSSVLGSYSQALGQIIWIIGMASTLTLSYIIVSRIINGNLELSSAVPAWLIPGVATIDIVVAGGTMPFPWVREINLLSLAIGGVFAIVFFTMLMSRLIHHAPLPAGLKPSMIIMIAPFEVGFLGYTNFVQRIDPFASILFYFGLFLFVVLFFKVFKKSIPFGASWWAVSFPMAALGNAALKYAIFEPSWVLIALSAIILAVLSIVLAVLFIRSIYMLVHGELLNG